MKGPEAIPFHMPAIGEAEIGEVVATLRPGRLGPGRKTAEFEEEFCRAVGARHGVAVTSGTAGLHLALAGLGIGVGDEVITSPLTYCATVSAILYTGARPVLADVGEDGNIDPQCIVRRLTRRTKAIIPVHLAGVSCDMDAIWKIALQRNIKVIEDAAHALGGGYKERLIGSSYGSSSSDAVVFSFCPSCNITTGEGGMVATSSEDLAVHMRLLSRLGIKQETREPDSEGASWQYDVLENGFKYALSDFQSSIGIHQLRKLARFQAEREAVARRYNEAFAEIPEIELPPAATHGTHAWHLYSIRLRLERLQIDRAEFIRLLRARNIGCEVHYIPIQNHRFFAAFAAANSCPRSLELYPRLVSLPLYPGLPEEHITRVVAAVKDIINHNKTTARAYLHGN